jgi:FixJ family two-component response regulator
MQTAGLDARAYPSGEEFLDAAPGQDIGCIVVDLRMAGLNGLDVLQRLRASGNEVPAIIISGHVDVPTAVSGMKLGAVDVLQKPFEPKALLDAVQGAIQKSREMHDTRSERESIRRRLATLTVRELDLLKMIVAGLPNKRIAADLGISIKTVANHRANLMAKTQALNAADLARMSTIAGVAAGR